MSGGSGTSRISTRAPAIYIPTRKEVRPRGRYYDSYRKGVTIEYRDIPEFEWHPTAPLTIAASKWPRQKWNDTERRLMLSRFSGIVAAIIALFSNLIAPRKKNRSAASAAYDEDRSLYEATFHARINEHRNLHTQILDANRSQRADRLRDVIAAVENPALRNKDLTPGKRQWIEWANAKADWLDLLVRRAYPILELPESKVPSYWDL